MTYSGRKYQAKEDSWGNIRITRLSDNASAYLQGDDTNDLRDSLERLELTAYPSGPFQDYESHLDVVLDQYDTVMTVYTPETGKSGAMLEFARTNNMPVENIEVVPLSEGWITGSMPIVRKVR